MTAGSFSTASTDSLKGIIQKLDHRLKLILVVSEDVVKNSMFNGKRLRRPVQPHLIMQDSGLPAVMWFGQAQGELFGQGGLE